LNQTVPAEIGHARFLHVGVHNLIFAVLLAGGLLAFGFQQPAERTSKRGTRPLAVLWIAQCLFLITGVALRLKLYVDQYGMLTPRRVQVGLFLLLVTAGFVFLLWHVIGKASLKKLLLRNAGATLALFFAIRFFNINGFVAAYNFDAWMREPEHIGFDDQFLGQIGEERWGLLLRVVATKKSTQTVARARERLAKEMLDETGHSVHWPEYQARREYLRDRLLNEAPVLLRP
jgi:hypothetical protein